MPKVLRLVTLGTARGSGSRQEKTDPRAAIPKRGDGQALARGLGLARRSNEHGG